MEAASQDGVGRFKPLPNWRNIGTRSQAEKGVVEPVRQRRDPFNPVLVSDIVVHSTSCCEVPVYTIVALLAVLYPPALEI